MTGCNCDLCDAQAPHRMRACRRKSHWRLEFHRVDQCGDGPERRTLCKKCFDDRVNLTKALIGWGMEGVRSPLCSTCNRPLVRLSAIIENVELV